MKQTHKIFLAAFLVVIVAGAGVSLAAAEENEPPRPLEILAELLDMELEELREQFREGATLEELAEEAGLDPAEIQEQIQVDREARMQEKIQEALDAGEITQEHADWLLEGLEKGFLGGGPSPLSGSSGGRQGGIRGGWERPTRGPGGCH